MDECPKCKDAWDRARAEYEAGGSPPSPPVVCPHMTQQTPEQVADRVIGESGVDECCGSCVIELRKSVAAAIREEREKAAALGEECKELRKHVAILDEIAVLPVAPMDPEHSIRQHLRALTASTLAVDAARARSDAVAAEYVR